MIPPSIANPLINDSASRGTSPILDLKPDTSPFATFYSIWLIFTSIWSLLKLTFFNSATNC